MIEWRYSDGGRLDAGYRGEVKDCVVRAVAIASGKPYREVYEYMRDTAAKRERRNKSHPRTVGIYCRSAWFKEYMVSLGFVWTPTMYVGSGCQVHMNRNELPMGRLVVMVSKHCAAVVDGVLYDNHDCSRDGNRCVYGYWHKE